MTNVTSPVTDETTKTTPTTNETTKTNQVTDETSKTAQIENHKKTAEHLNESAKHHLEAAKYHEAGDHEKAAQSNITAQGHSFLAYENQKDHAKKQALKK